ncbi:MAG: hypothetical protein JXB49_14565 [Bacteroidales bacterium]|nr:hypothetical protein [Bacteroidales bacterium]
MKEIVILTDYKNHFGSKQFSSRYRGGMDIGKLISLFTLAGYKANAIPISSLNSEKKDKDNTIFLYTSSEDHQALYKTYIEDIVYNLEQSGFIIIPSYSFLKAHNNKVSMELLRDRSKLDSIKTIRSYTYGTIEELKDSIKQITSYPVIVKSSAGAMSRGVTKADNEHELIEKATRLSRSFNLKHDIKEQLRKLKYRSNYSKESCYRSKFVVQNFIENLNNDWKVLVYGNTSYILYRGNRKDDFRASGSGNFIFRKDIPDGILDFAYSIKEYFNVPQISLDIGFDGNQFHLIEFQFLYFGTTTLEKSSFFFERQLDQWILREKKSDIEATYVKSMIDFISEHIIEQ